MMLDGSATCMFDTIRKRLQQRACGIEQREVLLVRAHREDQAFLRHLRGIRFRTRPTYTVGPFDQRGDLVEQVGVFVAQQRVPACLPRRAAPRCGRGARRSLGMTLPSREQRGS
jgi:hypothetical protein